MDIGGCGNVEIGRVCIGIVDGTAVGLTVGAVVLVIMGVVLEVAADGGCVDDGNWVVDCTIGVGVGVDVGVGFEEDELIFNA